MKRNRKRKKKRMERKRMKRKKRRKRKLPQIQWLTDNMFVMHFDDDNINNLFSSVTVEIVEDDDVFPDENDQDVDSVDLN